MEYDAPSNMVWADAMDKLNELWKLHGEGENIDPTTLELLKIEALLSISQEISGANIHNHTVPDGKGNHVPESTVITVRE